MHTYRYRIENDIFAYITAAQLDGDISLTLIGTGRPQVRERESLNRLGTESSLGSRRRR